MTTIESDGISTLYKGDNGRWYIGHTDKPGTWWCGTHDEVEARKTMVRSQDFWKKHINHKDAPEVVRVNGEHVIIGSEDGGPFRFRGFGGRSFTIAFFDNSRPVIKTTNLWAQGSIPKALRDKLPDNAVFIEEEYDGQSHGV